MIKDLTHESNIHCTDTLVSRVPGFVIWLCKLRQVKEQRCQVQVNLYQCVWGGGGRGDGVLLQMLAGVLGRSPGHAGVRTVPDIRLQRPVRHLHQRRVRGQLWGTRTGKLMEMKPKSRRPPSTDQTHLVQDGFGRENVVQGFQRDVLRQRDRSKQR